MHGNMLPLPRRCLPGKSNEPLEVVVGVEEETTIGEEEETTTAEEEVRVRDSNKTEAMTSRARTSTMMPTVALAVGFKAAGPNEAVGEDTIITSVSEPTYKHPT